MDLGLVIITIYFILFFTVDEVDYILVPMIMLIYIDIEPYILAPNTKLGKKKSTHNFRNITNRQ